jgi:DNA-binding response OmpR family regulator
MPARRVLIVDDEPDTAELIRRALARADDLEPHVATSGEAALTTVASWPPDLVILDLNLPGMSGVEVCRALRSRPDTAAVLIIMLTARLSEDDRVAGFDAGADDYMTKPFSLRELKARVRALFRRGSDGQHRVPPVYKSADLVADFDTMTITTDGHPLQLSRREFELLRYLVGHKNRLVSRDQLLEDVWGYNTSVETRSVDVHVARLRTKLGAAARHIETVIGLGYRFVD